MASVTINAGPTSSLGDLPSYQNETLELFHLDFGLSDLVGADNLAAIAAALPMVEYYGGNQLVFDSPNLSVPGYGTFDFKAYAGLDINLGAYLQWGFDFGRLAPSVTVNAPRQNGAEAYMSYVLDTATTSVTAKVTSQTGTEPFYLRLGLGGGTALDGNGNEVIQPGQISGGLTGVGIYKNGTPYATTDFGFNTTFDPLYYDLVGPAYPGSTVASFDTGVYSGFVKVPQLPAVSVTAGGTGLGAFASNGTTSGLGPRFAELSVRPINAIPLVGTLNSQNINIIQSPLIDAGLAYTVLGLDLNLSASFRHSLDVRIDTVNVTARLFESLSEDGPGMPDRSALDGLDGAVDGFVLVDTATGVLGDKLELDNFSEGIRQSSMVREEYSITLRINTDIDLVLTGEIDLSFLSLSAFINPILIDELRLNLGPAFSATLGLELAAVDLYSDWFTVTFTSPAVIEHEITTIADVSGTPGDDLKNMVPGQKYIDGGAGNDTLRGNGLANHMLGGSGNDTVQGGNGHDTLYGGDGADTLNGGTGDDILNLGLAAAGNTQVEWAFGGDGDDYLIGPASRGVFDGDDGDDTLDFVLRAAGGQFFNGGNGFDTLRLDASALTIGLNLSFATGNDTLIEESATTEFSGYTSIEALTFKGGQGNDTLTGTASDDNIRGGLGADKVYGGTGNDFLAGDTGNDSIFGGIGDDGVSGWEGDDSLVGNEGNDLLSGDAGNDTLVGGAGNDTLVAGDGNDVLSDVFGVNLLQGGKGDDSLTGAGNGTELDGGAGDDTLFAQTGDVLVKGGTGNDLIIATAGGLTLIGNAGSDTFRISGTGKQVQVFGDEFGLPGGGAPPTIFFNAIADVLEVLNFSSATSSGAAYVPPVGAGGAVTALGATGTLANGTGWSAIEAFIIHGDSSAQRLAGGGWGDTLYGGGGSDFLDGRGGTDALYGGSGNDTLVAGRSDFADGGTGNDMLVLAWGGETRAYSLSLGALSNRLIQTGGGFTRATERSGLIDGRVAIRNFERLNMVSGGSGNDSVIGAEFADTLRGGAGADTLLGGAGNDILWGENGADLLVGGAGDDTLYDFGTTRIGSSLDRLYGGEGNDSIFFTRLAMLVDGGSGNDVIEVSGTSGAGPAGHVVMIDGGLGSDSIRGTEGRDVIYGGVDTLDNPPDWMLDPEYNPLIEPRTVYDGNDTVHAGGGNDLVYGGDGHDSLNGGLGDDTLWGGAGNDTLTDDGGSDVIQGGRGNDSIVAGDGADSIVAGAGVDWVDGGSGSDVIYGGSGDDTLLGGDNEDEEGDAIWGEAGNDVIFGSDGVDYLSGGAGNDSIDGGAVITLGSSVETLLGGAGDDTIIAGGDADVDGGDGNDAISLGEGIQRVIVIEETGQNAGNDTITGFVAGIDVLEFSGPGLSFDFLQMTDTAGGLLISFTGKQFTVLLAGVQSTDMGPGAIVLNGVPATVRDALLVSSNTNASFAVSLLARNDLGPDVQVTGVATGTLSASMAGSILTVTTAASDGDVTYFAENSFGTTPGTAEVGVIATTGGNDTILLPLAHQGAVVLGSYIAAKAGDDSIEGTHGDDYLLGQDGNDTLVGNGGVDTLNGGAGNDVLRDLAGPGLLQGGLGDDTYVLRNTFGPTVQEFAGQGIDTALLEQGGTLWNHVENGVISRTLGATLTGNSLANQLTSHDGSDVLNGMAGADTLYGGAGNDVLDGGSGADRMLGGAGNDTYYVDHAGDRVVETLTLSLGGGAPLGVDAGGYDRVYSAVNLFLANQADAAFVEEIILTGRTNTSASGNILANTITGSSGNNQLSGGGGNDTLHRGDGADTLNGGTGNDQLYGGSGFDAFVFNSALVAGSHDEIMDFSILGDRIHLENAVFTGLAAGTLGAPAFWVNTSGAAENASDRIIYNSADGKLYFDRDGTGAAAGQHFATLSAGLALTAADFLVI